MTLRDYECALLIDEVAGADPPRYPAVDPVPLSFKVRLNLLQTVECTHLLLRSRLRGRRGLIRATRACSVVAGHLLLLGLLLLLGRTGETWVGVVVQAGRVP